MPRNLHLCILRSSHGGSQTQQAKKDRSPTVLCVSTFTPLLPNYKDASCSSMSNCSPRSSCSFVPRHGGNGKGPRRTRREVERRTPAGRLPQNTHRTEGMKLGDDGRRVALVRLQEASSFPNYRKREFTQLPRRHCKTLSPPAAG